MSHHQQWNQICQQSNWDAETQITHLLGFVDDVGMGKYLITYAQSAADEEVVQTKLAALEEVGYVVLEDTDQEGLYLWMAPSDGSEISYPTRKEAIESAWLDAISQALSIAEMTGEAFNALSVAAQCDIVRQHLA